MAGSTRRVTAAAAFGAAFAALVGCAGGIGGDSGEVETFDVDFDVVEDAQGVYTQSLMKAVDRCGAPDPPLQVRWTFDDDDVENPIAQEYIRDEYPSFIDCSTIQRGTGDTQLPGAVSQPVVTGAQAQESGGASSSTAP